MKVNWAEWLMVNSPNRVLVQKWLLLPWIKRGVSLPKEAMILEIGCGRGVGACLLLEAFRPRALYAMDLDTLMISCATCYVPPEQRGRIHLYVGDASQLPHMSKSMDAVFGFGVLHHLPDWRQGLAEISRVLKPGGIYFLEEFYPSLYLNFLARRLFSHPKEDRFFSQDLHRALKQADLVMERSLEHPKLGILATCRKSMH
jgi:ubiquinone/menaquinone biosynthesis C-methylase UbiE